MLLSQTSAVPCIDYTRPVCLPPAEDPDHVGDWAMISGWGYVSESMKEIICSRRLMTILDLFTSSITDSTDVSPVLRKANVTILPSEDCYPDMGDSILCTSAAEGRGICYVTFYWFY
jgi:hypothetical protein